jgi:hypothetical protein
MSTLFPSGEYPYRLDHALTDALINAHERLVRGSVTPTFNLESSRTQLAAIDFERPWSLDEILSWNLSLESRTRCNRSSNMWSPQGGELGCRL